MIDRPIKVSVKRAQNALIPQGVCHWLLWTNSKAFRRFTLLLASPFALKHYLHSLTSLYFSIYSHSARRDAMRSSSTPTRRSFTGHHTLMPAAQAHTVDLFVPTRAFISWTFGRGTVVRIRSPKCRNAPALTI